MQTTNRSSKALKVLVLGATGNQGGAVAHCLLKNGFGVRAVARDPAKEAARSLADEGAEIIQADLNDRSSLEAAMREVYGVYVVLPFFQEHQEREVKMGQTVIDAARAMDVQHLIYSAGSRSNERTGVPHLDSKGEIERYLRSSNVPYTILRPVAFNYSLAAYRESILQGQLIDPRDGNSVVYQLAEDDHASFATMALLDPQNWLWQGFNTASDALTIREMATVFGRVVGRTVEHVQISWEEERQVAGDEVVRLTQWVDQDGPRINMQARHQKYPWLTSLEHYLRTHGWKNLAVKS
ncbi:MAG: NmrA/HSCARG family protein [Stenomitos rutilans HA7619-LM2]|jgi:uncharacterized protein YbjT (DUF2867 family)|nr:NmrA/HSCARG family protein [Stenomitos rutilans HA7619-LM2]